MRKSAHIVLAFALLGLPASLPAQAKPDSATPATQPAFRPVQGQRVEVYRVRQWWSATVREVRGDQVLIRNDQRAHFEEWVPLSTLRKYTKAGKYPMPASDAEIDAQNEIESARRHGAAPRSVPRLPNRAGRPDDFVDADVSPIDMSSVRRLSDNPDIPFDGVAPDPEPAPRSVSPRPMPLAGKPDPDASPFDPRPAGLFAAPAAGQVFALSEIPGFRPIKLLQRFDVAAGTPSPAVTFESSMTLNAVSPDGTRFVGTNNHRKGHFAEPEAVEVWSLAGKEPKLLVAFTPTADEHEGHFVDLARFVDNDHVLTLTLGKVTCWEVPAAKAVYTRDLGRGVVIAVSPTGKYLAAAAGASVRLFDAATGAFRGQLPAADPPVHPSHLAFSPAGDRLLAAEQQRTVVYDLTKSAVVADIALPAPLSGGLFLSDDYLLVNGRYVVHVARRAVLWDYVHGDGPFRTLAGRLWYLSQPQSPYTPSLYSAALPTDEAVKAAPTIDPAALYAVQPGTRVALSIDDTGLSGDDHAKAVAAVRAAATAAGWVLADDAPVRLVATHTAGEAKEIQYRMFGGETRKVSAATHTYALSVRLPDGKTLWQTGTSLGPSFMIHLKKDESIEQHLDADRERAATAFFTGVRFPKYLAKPTDHPGLGQTTLPGASADPGGQKSLPPRRPPSRRPGAPSGGKPTSA